jgi:hypothetical protein
MALATLPISRPVIAPPTNIGLPSYNTLFGNPPLLGRVEAQWELLQQIVRKPDDPGEVVRIAKRHEVLPIYGSIHADPPTRWLRHNDVWFDVGDGYIHSSYVVPVHEVFTDPEEVGDGFWGEISVPEVWLQWRPMPNSQGRYRLAYGTVYWIAERADDADGHAWYRLLDDGAARAWWIEARCVRRIHPTELLPLSPDLTPNRKRIEISIAQQRLTCLEDAVPAFSTRIASGTAYINPEGKQFGFNTPIGEHRVVYKRPTRHMSGGDPKSRSNHYDLPGIPWCTYFTPTGAAIHGTYWHNNYGRPGSHGCINVPSDAAKWIYRWTRPVMSYDNPAYWTTQEEYEVATVVSVQN